MSASAILVMVLVALAVGAVVGWVLAAARERARGEATLRTIEGTARAGQATADELRRSLGVSEDRAQVLAHELSAAQQARAVAETQTALLRRSLDEQKALLDSAEEKLGDTFRPWRRRPWPRTTQGFLTLAAEKLGAARKETDGIAGRAAERPSTACSNR